MVIKNIKNIARAYWRKSEMMYTCKFMFCVEVSYCFRHETASTGKQLKTNLKTVNKLFQYVYIKSSYQKSSTFWQNTGLRENDAVTD